MKYIPQIWLTALLSIVLPSAIWLSYNAFILRNCDPKFGCMGGFVFGVSFQGIHAFIGAFAISCSYMIFRNLFKNECKRYLYTTTFVAGFSLSFVTLISYILPSVIISAIAWFILSIIVSYVFYLINQKIFK